MQSIDMVVDATREFLHQIAAFLPRLLLALLVVVVGWLFAKAVRFAVERSLRAVNFNVLTERAGTDNFLKQAGMRGDTTTLFGIVAFWLAILATLIIAFNGLGLTYITDLLGRIVLYLIMTFVIMIALSQVEIGGDIVQRTFLIILAGLMLALALAFGLGGKDWAAALLQRWWPHHKDEDS